MLLPYARLAMMLAFWVPALALISPTAGPILFYTLMALVLLAVVHMTLTRRAAAQWGEFTWLAIAFIFPLVSILVTALYTGNWSGSEFEKWLRFALAWPVGWLLCRAPVRWLQQVQWSFVLGALAGSLTLIVIMHDPMLGRGAVAVVGAKYNAVTFANLTLLFGFAVWLTLPWQLTAWPKFESGLKIVTTLLSLYAVALSNTRSSWMLLFALGVVIFAAQGGRWSRMRKAACAVTLLAVLAAGVIFLVQNRENRVQEAVTDITSYVTNTNRNTSIGIRLQLWHASWQMFLKHPILGNGLVNFRSNLIELQKEGVVTSFVAPRFGEPHNDFMAAMAGYGTLGLLSMLALYGIPAWVFYRRLASSDPAVQVGAQLGLLVCVGYFFFSQTEMMFRNMRSVPVYVITVAMLAALTTARKQASIAVSTPSR